MKEFLLTIQDNGVKIFFEFPTLVKTEQIFV